MLNWNVFVGGDGVRLWFGIIRFMAIQCRVFFLLEFGVVGFGTCVNIRSYILCYMHFVRVCSRSILIHRLSLYI